MANVGHRGHLEHLQREAFMASATATDGSRRLRSNGHAKLDTPAPSTLEMTIAEAQHEMRDRFQGGFFGQLVSGILWLIAAGLGTWVSARASIATLVIGGFFIFPATELLLRVFGSARPLSAGNTLPQLGMQVAFVLPLSMPLLLPVGLYRLEWFYPALMLLVGAHYLPFVFLYGMPMFAALAALLVGGGVIIAMFGPTGFTVGAWYTAVVLLVFAIVGRSLSRRPSAPSTP